MDPITNKHPGCGSQLSRRQVLKLGSAAAVAELSSMSGMAFKRTPLPPAVRAIDIHSHYFPLSYLDVLENEGKQLGAEYQLTSQNLAIKAPPGSLPSLLPNIVNLDGRIADMDRQGVDVQVISLTNPMAYWGDEALSHKLSAAWNDGASAAHLAHPTRIFAFLTLPMLYPDCAIEELRRAGKLPGMCGVYLGTNIDHRDLDDPLFQPVFEQIEKLGLPVFLHPLETVGGPRLKPFYLSNLLGNPFDTAIAACHLIFGGVLDRYPKLQINLPHGGGALPILIGRIDHGWRVRPETEHLANAPSSYLQRFTYDTIVHSKQIMEFLIQQVGTERIMLGSDYCLDMGYEQPVRFLEQINLSSKQRAMILGGNAESLLRLSAQT
jgi:aminocarboxymuconate-semialdehyde decarboxylase